MQKLCLSATFLLALVLSGCASTAPPSCDGSERRPVNQIRQGAQ